MAAEPRLWLLGYGDWTGAASATLAGITRVVRAAVAGMMCALAAKAESVSPSAPA